MARTRKIPNARGRQLPPASRFPVAARVRQSLAIVLSTVLTFQPVLVQAQTVSADVNAAAANRPGIDKAGNGVPLVNIVTPNGAGLSHNKYSDFNVGTPGLILNNSNEALTRSQLGGLVQGNANLRQSGPASVILNEVTSANRSLLQGATEVHGTRADVVIANPNGVTCNGCGFINTPRVTLSTGTPELGADGALARLRVEKGDVTIGANGADLSRSSVFDIVSRTISVGGPVRAGGDFNLIAGRNTYAYGSGAVTPLGSDGNEPAIAIDSSALGGMYAGRIKLIATDKGSGVNMKGNMAANAGAMTLSADGSLTLGKSYAKGAATVRSTSRAVRIENTLFSDDAVVLDGRAGVELADKAFVGAKGNVALAGTVVTLRAGALAASGMASDGTLGRSGTLDIRADRLLAGNGQLAAGGLLSVVAGVVDIRRTTDTKEDTLFSNGAITIEAGAIKAQNGRVASSGDLTLSSSADLAIDGGRFTSGNMLLATAASLTSTASLNALARAELEARRGALVQAGEVAANSGVTLTAAGDLTHSGRTVSTGRVSISTSGALNNEASGVIASKDSVAFAARDIANAGAVAAEGGRLDVTASRDLSNAGTMSGAIDVVLSAGRRLDNAGTAVADGALTLDAGTALGNAGTAQGGTVILRSASLANDGTLTARSGALSGTVTGTLTNRGELSTVGDLTLDGMAVLDNSGRIASLGATTLSGTNGGVIDRFGNAASGSIDGATGLSLRAGSFSNDGLVGASKGALTAGVTGMLVNRGLLFGAKTSDVTVAGDLTNRGEVSTRAGLTLGVGGALGNDGRILATDHLALSVTGGVSNNVPGTIQGGDVSLSSASLANAGVMTATAGMFSANVNGLAANTGTVSAKGDLAFGLGGAFSNSGKITSSGTASFVGIGSGVTGTFTNMAGATINGYGGLTLNTASLTNAGMAGSGHGAVTARTVGDLANSGLFYGSSGFDLTSGGALSNSGEVSSGGALGLVVAGPLSNQGKLLSASTLTIGSGGALTNGAGSVIEGASATIGATSLGNAGTLTTGNGPLALTLSGNLANSGELSSRAGLTATGVRELTNSGKLVSIGTMALSGIGGGLIGAFSNTADGLINGEAGLTFGATSLSNAGQFGSSHGNVAGSVAGNIDNTGILYAGASATYALDGTFTNTNADVAAEQGLTIKGLSGTHAAGIVNASGLIEAVSGDMVLKAGTVTNTRIGGTSIAAVTAAPVVTKKGNVTTTTVTTRDTATVGGIAGRILSGGSILIDTGTLTNSYSLISALRDLTIRANTVVNEGRDLIETIDRKEDTLHSQRYCSKRVLGICIRHSTRYWTTTETSVSTGTYDAIFGTIEAGGALIASVSGYLSNNAVRGNSGQTGLSSGATAIAAAKVADQTVAGTGIGAVGAANAVAGASLATSGLSAGIDRASVPFDRLNVSIATLSGRQASFEPASSVNMPYVIETRSQFIDASKFLGSDYFLSRIGGYKPESSLKRLGDAYYEWRLVEEQIFDRTGSRTLGAGLDPAAIMRGLYDNALSQQKGLQLSAGIALTPEQIGRLTSDIVWMEKQTVDGREVLVPRLYLSKATIDTVNPASARIGAGTVSIAAGGLTNSGAVASQSKLAIATAGSLFNDGGSLFARTDVVIDAGGIFANRSGTVSGNNVAIRAAAIVNDTAVVRDVFANGFGDRIQQQARIDARGGPLLEATGAITSTGGRFTSGGDMVLNAGSAIDIGGLRLETSRNDTIRGGYDRAATLTHTLASLAAGGDLKLRAGTDLTLSGATAKAGGDASLKANGDVTIASVQDAASRDMKLDIKTGGMFGTETNIRNESSSVETKRTTVEAGGDLAIRSETGDVKLVAPQLKSGGETNITADQGQVAALANTDQSYAKSYKREEDLLWWNQRDQGRYEETIRHVEIEAGGGVKIDAGNGIVIEYHKTGNLEASLDQLSKSPGLAWVNTLRNDPALAGKIDWKAVDAQFQHWDYKSQGLTEAGAALVTLVTAAITGPMTGLTSSLTSSLAGSLGLAGNAAAEAAIQAGLQTLMNKSAVALVNNQGDLGAALKELGSSASIRSLLTSMVTAGLTTQLVGMVGIKDVTAGASFQENLLKAAQKNLIEASIRAGVGITIGGEKADKALVGALRQAAASTIGSVLANQIGDYAAFNGVKDGDIQKIVLHAIAGCAAGAAGSGDCVAGAIGSGLAELIGKPLAEAIPDPARQTALLSLIAGTAGALASRSADAVNAASNAAATTHQYNYLNHEELQAALANRKALEKCTQLGSNCSRDEISALVKKDADFVAQSQINTSALLQICLAAPSSQACSARVADLKKFADRLESERDSGLVFADPMNSASGFSVKRSIFDYDLVLARSLADGSKPADVVIRDFVVGMSKSEGKVNSFLSAIGVVGGLGVCASGVGTAACAVGALGAIASGNHLYGDVQQAVTGNEARTALVQALTSNGFDLAEAQKYQAYVDAGVVVVSLGVVGGQAVYRFAVNGAKVNAADRAALAALERKGGAGAAGSIDRSGFDTSNLESKLSGYLLNPMHPQNQSKADWFKEALGFKQSNWQELAAQLKFDATTAVPTKATQYGQTYEQVIAITGVNGRTINTTFIFMKDNSDVVRFITGIPTKR